MKFNYKVYLLSPDIKALINKKFNKIY